MRLALSTLLALSVSTAAAAQASDALRDRAAMIANRYLQGWSSGNAQALADVRRLYGARVSFYGRTYGQQDLLDEKRRFGQRWPIRRYAHRPGTMRISCEAARQACLVRSIVDWWAGSPVRGKVAHGSSTFELGIAFAGPKPVVLFERGQVMRTARAPQAAE